MGNNSFWTSWRRSAGTRSGKWIVLCCQSICDAGQILVYAAVAVIPAGRIAVVVTHLRDPRDGMVQKLEKIALINRPFEDDSANNLPLKFLAPIGPRKFQEIREAERRAIK